MDLAEIRKKAKGENRGGDARLGGRAEKTVPPTDAAGSARVSSIQGTPPETGRSSALQATAKGVSGSGPEWHDPLETLFASRPDIELATEESYTQSLSAGKDEAEQELSQWLSFSLGKEEYALEIESIREIIKPRDITDIPRAPGFILGIISLRGIVIPVFDLKNRLNLGRVETSGAARIIVCQVKDRMAGLLVEGITQVVRLPAGSLEAPPGVLSGLDRDMVEGVGRYQGRMLIALRLESVLNAELV